MIILSHPHIPCVDLVAVDSIHKISQTTAEKVVRFAFDWELLKHCHANGVAAAVDIVSVKQAVYANALEAKFLLCTLDVAKKVQPVAENYLFDAKVIAKHDCRLIEEVIAAGIDGILCTNYN